MEASGAYSSLIPVQHLPGIPVCVCVCVTACVCVHVCVRVRGQETVCLCGPDWDLAADNSLKEPPLVCAGVWVCVGVTKARRIALNQSTYPT